MKTVIRLIIWAVIVFFLYKGAIWAIDHYQSRNSPSSELEIDDFDKECIMDADTGRCICRHKRTGEFLKLPYEECKARATENL